MLCGCRCRIVKFSVEVLLAIHPEEMGQAEDVPIWCAGLSDAFYRCSDIGV